MGQAILKDNLISEIDESYIRIPYDILGTEFVKFSITELFQLAKIFSFSVIESNPMARCRSKLSEFAEDFHASERQCSRLIKRLVDAELVEKVTDENGQIIRSWYRYIGNPISKKDFIRVDVANLQTEYEFKPDKKGHSQPYKRYLTLIEVLVLSYIITNCDNVKRRKNEFLGSYRSIARKLKLSVGAVSTAIFYLMKAELIYCHAGDKAKNGGEEIFKTKGSGFTKYHVDEKLLLRTKKADQKKTEELAQQAEAQTTFEGQRQSSVGFVSPAVLALNARADRERYYSQLREKAQNIADQQIERANKDAEFKQVERELRGLECSLAKAEVQGDRKELFRLMQIQKELQKRRLARLQVLAMCEEDFLPRYRCAKCSDTGFLPNGRACDCYPKQE